MTANKRKMTAVFFSLVFTSAPFLGA